MNLMQTLMPFMPNIVTLKDEKFDAESKIRNLDREVGPNKYLVQLIYGSEEREVLDEAYVYSY